MLLLVFIVKYLVRSDVDGSAKRVKIKLPRLERVPTISLIELAAATAKTPNLPTDLHNSQSIERQTHLTL